MSDDPILIVGAGPAGAAAGRLLAAWGHRVVVVDRPGSSAGRLAESIPASTNKLLRTIGALDEVAAAGFLPWRGNTVWWADEPAREESFPEGTPGYQVLRRDFDACLRRVAVIAGIRLVEGRVTAIQLANRPGERARVLVDRADTPTVFHPQIVIDASGRSGVLASEGYRQLDQGRRTVALAGSWRRGRGWPIDDNSHTLVASYAGGWAWSVPVDAEVRQFTVMIDPSRSALARGARSREVYLAEVAKVTPFRPILADAQLVEAPWGADASEYTARTHAGPGFLLAGDAGSAINPLSSFGVKKALASGWLAAIAAHTALEDVTMAEQAFAFFNRRERAVAAAAARQASVFAREAASRTEHPFWLARADGGDDPMDSLEPDAAALARAPDVVAAFSDLRARESVHLKPGPEVRIEPRAAVRGRRIVMEDHLVSAAWPDGLRYIRGVDLVALFRLAPNHADAGELFEAVRATCPDISLPDFLGALSVLIAKGDLRQG
jgi:flavin-dependent dehydrogenase